MPHGTPDHTRLLRRYTIQRLCKKQDRTASHACSRKRLAEIFRVQTRQTHGILVSVTRVRISPDLSICTAYLSIFPSEKANELIENIRNNEKSIRYELGRRVHNQLRIIPELRFFIDDSLDYIDHIDELLKK